MVVADERAGYWQATAGSTGPMSPNKKEALRGEVLRKQDFSTSMSTQKLGMYKTQAQARATQPLNRDQYLQDPKVQDWMHASGRRPTVPSLVPDNGIPNVNDLRFVRSMHMSEVLPRDGGVRYSTSVLTGNWLEETKDRRHLKGWHPKELRTDMRYATEHTDRFTPFDSAYVGRLKQDQGVAKAPEQAGGIATCNQGDSKVVYYGDEGFGKKSPQDHTIPARRGAHWVGIAPTHSHETIVMSANNGQRLEFQGRDPCSVRDKILTHERTLDWQEPRTLRTMTDLYNSQLHTATWKTMYSSDYKDFSGRPKPQQQLQYAQRPATSLGTTAMLNSTLMTATNRRAGALTADPPALSSLRPVTAMA